MIARLGDIAEFINGGAWSDKEYTETGIPVVKVTNLKNGMVDLSEVNYIPESSLDKYGKHTLRKGDLVIATVGSHPNLVASAAGRATIIPSIAEGALLNQNALCLRSNSEILYQGYLGYLGKSDLFQGYVKSIGRGAANQVRIALGLIKEFSFNLPPLPTQRKIASILSAYDDLIENNLKRIKLLEEKAQLHYKELMQDSARWDKVRLQEFVSVVKGRKPANVLEQPEEESQLYLLLDTVERGKTLYTTDLSLPQSKITDVLMCMDGARSGLSFRGMVGAIGSTMAIWRSNSERVSGEFLYQFMKQNESAITQGNIGAAIPHANRKFILDMKMAMPPKKEAEYFDGLTLPMIKLINTLHNQNTKFREARDILLPKLMNGQIEV
jgi:type I restriction enzyme S subunit